MPRLKDLDLGQALDYQESMEADLSINMKMIRLIKEYWQQILSLNKKI
jgi:hypothetical protein